jgi:hypothetical protein
MTTEQMYRRQEFVHRVRAGIGAFVRNTRTTKSGNLHIDSSHVEHWHETDWPELPGNVRREISGWVAEYLLAVDSFETTSVPTPHTTQYALQLLEDISRQLVERHVVT